MQALLRNEAHERRQEELRNWLNDAELGLWRRHYVGFFANQIHSSLPGQPIHVDFRDERRFTETIKRRHTKAEHSRMQEALDSMHDRFFQALPERYTLYPKHVEALHNAEQLIKQIEAAQAQEEASRKEDLTQKDS